MKMFVAALAALSAGTAIAHGAECKLIEDGAARLACFDQQNLSPPTDPRTLDAEKAVLRILKDPDSAKFGENPKLMPLGVCGTVNARNSMGGYTGAVPFVYVVADNSAYLVRLTSRPRATKEELELHLKSLGAYRDVCFTDEEKAGIAKRR